MTHVWIVATRTGSISDFIVYETKREAVANAKRLDMYWPEDKPHRAVKLVPVRKGKR